MYQSLTRFLMFSCDNTWYFDYVRCVPEFVFENLCSYLVLLRRFYPNALEEKGPELLEPVLTALIVYMGSNKLVRNPHLRAKLAECIDCLLPTPAEMEMPEIGSGLNYMNFFYRTKLFNDHPYRHRVSMRRHNSCIIV